MLGVWGLECVMHKVWLLSLYVTGCVCHGGVQGCESLPEVVLLLCVCACRDNAYPSDKPCAWFDCSDCR